KAPYVRWAGVTRGQNGDEIYKYDLRFKQPNKAHMEMPALHSIEHLMAEKSRNHSDQIVDIDPMGCETSFDLAMINHRDYDDVLGLLEKTLEDVIEADEVPACNEVQCGWAASHSLEDAKALAKEMLDHKSEWENVF